MSTPTNQPPTTRRAPIVAALPLAILLSCLAVSACGGSSHPAKSAAANATNATQTSATAAVTPAPNGAAGTGATGSNAGGTHANGGSNSPGTPAAGGGTTTPPSGTNNNSPSNTPSSGQHTTSHSKLPAAVVAALKAFAHCVRAHGLNIPEPNLSGHGEIFNTHAVNQNSPQYRSALEGCESYLLAILRAAGASGAHVPGIG